MIITIQIGRVYNARLITTNNSTWLHEQTNTNTCLCSAMNLFPLTLRALNYFQSNRSCQLFYSSINSPEIISQINTTLILLESLPVPCCSNLTWLLTRIQRAQKFSSTNVASPTFLSINSANQLLSVMSYHGSRYLLNRTNLNTIINTTSVGTNCGIASQFGDLFISSCDTPYSIRIYNETIFGLQLLSVINTTNIPRQAVLLSNNSLLLIAVQYTRHIDIYSVDLVTKIFRFNQSVTIPYDVVWSLTEYNDTLIYICFWRSATPVLALTYNGLSWIVSNLTATQPASNEISTQVSIDSCGRLWASVYGFGIRVYDTTGQTLLANWSIGSTTVDTLLIMENYEILLGDYDNNKIYRYTTDLQCTS